MSDTDVIRSGIALLASEEPEVVHGVALGAEDITEGMSGKRTLWPGSVLEEAADELIGKPLVRDHPGVSKDGPGLQVDAQPPIESVIGEVTDAKFKEGVGLMFEAELDDEQVATLIERGRLEVSPVVSRELGEFDEEKDAHRVKQIGTFRDLAVVTRGASASASIQPGTAAAMAEALSAAFGTESDDEGNEESDAQAQATSDSTASVEVTEDEAMLLSVARTTEQPVVVERAIAEGVETMHTALAEALADRTGLSEDTARALDFETLMGEFEDSAGNIDTDVLVQSPETGTIEGDTASASRSEALSRTERKEKELLEQRIEMFEERGWENAAETNREKLADLTGNDSILGGAES